MLNINMLMFYFFILMIKFYVKGKCSLKEQLPTLRLLLDFMKKIHVESFASTNETERTLTDIIKVC